MMKLWYCWLQHNHLHFLLLFHALYLVYLPVEDIKLNYYYFVRMLANEWHNNNNNYFYKPAWAPAHQTTPDFQI